jgi:PPM family protein phosphatase
MRLSIGATTDVGQVREGNEDSYLVSEPLFVVADGMGGHIAGDVASSTAVDIISNRADSASSEDPQTLADLVRSANTAILDKAEEDPALRGMGTTCTLALLDRGKAFLAHIGDSRAYLLRDGRLEQVTEDHTLVARMVKEGRIRPEDADHHPQRSIITRALGVEPNIDVDLISLDLRDGDRLMLCSDGLSSMIGSDSIQEGLVENADSQSASDDLVRRANEAGGEDNITVVVIDVVSGGAGGSDDETMAISAVPPPPPPKEEPPAPPARKEARSPEPVEHTSARRWPKTVAIVLVVLLLLGGGAFALINYMRTSSWYVGLNADDRVAIFQGRPENLFGIDLDKEVEATELTLADLPENLRDNVEKGREADSREDAEQIVSDLEQRAQDLEDAKPEDDPDPKTSPSPSGNNDGQKGDQKKNN